ncbi:MAG: SET domain-containing protein [Patescibacteria group bacterium]|nr:SET domain-containing protein [Patescibacteria group bacterium]
MVSQAPAVLDSKPFSPSASPHVAASLAAVPVDGGCRSGVSPGLPGAVGSPHILAKIAVYETGNRGRGVFAQQRFQPGDVIEQAPVVVIPEPQWELLEQTALRDYYCAWDEENDCFALGYGAVYNHSDQPSARRVYRKEQRIMEFIADRAIEPGEEITVCYRCVPWFRVE